MLFDAGKLNEAQAKFWRPKPVEELFDLESDPDETINVADQPEHASRVATMRGALKDWMVETLDCGLLTEAEMHRAAAGKPPRQYALENREAFLKIANVAFAAMDKNGLTQTECATTGQRLRRRRPVLGCARLGLLAISVRFEVFGVDGGASGYVSAERDGYFGKTIAVMLKV